MSQLTVFLALAFSIVIAIFAVQNSTSVPVSFLAFGPASMAVSVLVLISAALGALVILVLGIPREVSLRWRHRSTSQQLRQAQTRIATLEAAQAQTTAIAPVEPASAAPPPPTT